MNAYSVSPEGTVTQHDRVDWLKWNADGSTGLYTGDPNISTSKLRDRVPATHIVTFDKPGVEFKGSPGQLTADAALDIVSRCIRSYRPIGKWHPMFDKLATIKRELQSFDARGEGWK